MYIFRVEDRYLFDAQDVLRGLIQLNPVEIAVTRVWINADYDPFVPAFVHSEFGIQVNFYAIPDADWLGHVICDLKTRIAPLR